MEKVRIKEGIENKLDRQGLLGWAFVWQKIFF